jgi:hypothetical protein
MYRLTLLHQALIEPITFAANRHGWRVEGVRVSRFDSCYLLLSRAGQLLTLRIADHASKHTDEFGPSLNVQPHRRLWWDYILLHLRNGPGRVHPLTPDRRRAYFAGRPRGGVA